MTSPARTILDIAPRLTHQFPVRGRLPRVHPEYRLPTPHINVRVNGREVDAYFPEHNLIVELDGWDYHKDREAFESDRERDAENLRHGLKTLRITKQRMTQTPDREAERLQEILQDGQGVLGSSYGLLPEL